MRRTLSVLLVAGLAVLALPSRAPASPPGGDARGPACTDIADGFAVYDGSTVQVQMLLNVPGCARFGYTVDVLAKDGSGAYTVAAGSQTLPGDASTPFNDFHQLVFSIAVPAGTGSSVCIVGTTHPANGPNDFDVAPDTGCFEVTAGGPTQGSFFR
jgi:hypothetical protein